MNKRILLIGNDKGLPGVKVDLANYRNFFKSPYGGNWYDTEITEMLNPTKIKLKSALEIFKFTSLDYFIVIFSGHGGQERETILELNSQGETIGESELHDIACRQLNIFDCCRCYPEPISKGLQLEALEKLFTEFNTRSKFEKRISESVHQQVLLYACSIGEYSYDTSDGGIYSQYLLKAANNIVGDFKLLGTAHDEASIKTIEKTKNSTIYDPQNPEAILPRCLTSQQLIIGVNPFA